MDWFTGLELFEQIGVVLGALDIILGAVPDKWTKYPGLTLSVFHKLHQYGKEEKGKYRG